MKFSNFGNLEWGILILKMWVKIGKCFMKLSKTFTQGGWDGEHYWRIELTHPL
jgi:hypothetical protein